MTASLLRLVLNPVGEELAAAQRCEAEVFLTTYGNTAEQFQTEYGPYVENTTFLVVLEENGEAAAAARIITPGRAGLKTLNDVARPPWEVDGMRSARAAGIDPTRTWDVSTIAVRKGSGRGGLCAAALYHGIIYGAYVNDVDYFVMIMDSHVRELVSALDISTHPLPGTTSGEYLGSPNSTPLWGNLRRGLEQQRHSSPDAYRLIFHGIGLDGITLPSDWTVNSSPPDSSPPLRTETSLMNPGLAQRTIDLALTNVEQGGKPFACIVVDHETGAVLHEATNQVAQSGDVSAHAEIMAIRDLAAAGRTDLTGCDVYITAYPCPMCLGALYYAAPEQVFFAASREQENREYEDGGRYMTLATFYDEYTKAAADQNLPSEQITVEDPTAAFRAWTARHDG